MTQALLKPSAVEEQGWTEIVRPLAAGRLCAVHDLAVSLSQSIHDQLDLSPQLLDLTIASAESGLSDIYERLVTGGQPADYVVADEAVTYVQELAHLGLPVETMFRIGHAGQAYIMRHWLTDLYAHPGEQEVKFGAVSYCEQFIFLWIDALARQWRDHYLTEQERQIGGLDVARLDTLRAIIEGQVGNVEEASARLRYQLEGMHRAFVIWGDSTDAKMAVLRNRARSICELLEAPYVLMPVGAAALVGWLGAATDVSHGPIRAMLSDGKDRFSVAFGSPQAGVDGFRRTHQEALEARRVASLSHRPGHVHEYRSLALAALATADMEHACRFVAQELGALFNDDEATVRIRATLTVYFEELGSAGRTAQRLGLHKNTVLYRLRRAEEILGRTLDERRLELQVALTICRALEEAP